MTHIIMYDPDEVQRDYERHWEAIRERRRRKAMRLMRKARRNGPDRTAEGYY